MTEELITTPDGMRVVLTLTPDERSTLAGIAKRGDEEHDKWWHNEATDMEKQEQYNLLNVLRND